MFDVPARYKFNLAWLRARAKLKASRQARYEQVANLKIQTARLTPEEICQQAKEILAAYELKQ